MVYYKNEQFILRDIKESDIIRLFYWSVDKEINKYDPRPLPNNSRQLLDECASYCRSFEEEVLCENEDDRKYKYFIITDNYDEPIGFINFFGIDREKKQGELGIVLGDMRYWKKGIAFISLNFVTQYIFESMGFERICIETGENNKNALKLFNKANFIKCDEYLEDEDFKFIVMEKLSR